ncbi:MAG TPA: sulfide dehydrogenase [Acetobacteraceae bacterium]|nr:sulfide dehydrogenase [Acetobacteraceae bacterium]
MRLAIGVMAVLVGAAAPPPGALSCSGCHGGVAPLPVLAGRNADEIVARLDEFRTGAKPATVMDRIAKGFSHDESVAIAAWWATQK